jgi:hypothetical protein
MSPADLMENRIEDELSRWRASGIEDAHRFNGFRPPRQFPGNAADKTVLFRNDAARDALACLLRR